MLTDDSFFVDSGAGHIQGALDIGGRPELSVWAGWLLDPEKPICLVLEQDGQLPRVLPLLWRTGLTHFGGYVAGSMAAWQETGREMAEIPWMTVHELKGANGAVQPLDVRKDGEWEGGHIPGARHVFLGELRDRLGELDCDRPLATYYASGFRASIAASMLAAHGLTDVRNVPGSWMAWKSAGYPAETG